MSNLIDRQAAIDELVKMLGYCFQADEEVIDAVVTTINELPSAQLGTNLAEVGTDCISRQQAIDVLCRVDEYNSRSVEAIKQLPSAQHELSEEDRRLLKKLRSFHNGSYAKVIDRLMSAQPDIVRCKDCKHWIPYDWMFSEVWQSKNKADYPEDAIGCNLCDMAMKSNDFCSRGERREVTE